MKSSSRQRSIVFLWENFGPVHVDRCEATARHFGPNFDVVGLELFKKSSVYDWDSEEGECFKKITLFRKNRKWFPLIRLLTIVYNLAKINNAVVFLCHYERIEIFFTALFCRVFGIKVFVMGDTKFDDRPRNACRELLKDIWFKPYNGALTQEGRSVEYFEFHGFKRSTISTPYNAIDVNRIRKSSDAPLAPNGRNFNTRHFTIIARLIEEKNIPMALEAYRIYANQTKTPRKLYICGSGPMYKDLTSKVEDLDLSEYVVFTGFLQWRDVCKIFASTLAVILPSKSESFGFVVPEAQAMGLPVVVTTAVGALDSLVSNGSNGFVVEPDNPQGLAWYLQMLDEDEKLWKRMCDAAQATAPKSDAKHFAKAVEYLMNLDT